MDTVQPEVAVTILVLCMNGYAITALVGLLLEKNLNNTGQFLLGANVACFAIGAFNLLTKFVGVLQ